MPLKAGFAEIDITPPVGTHKIGCIIDIVTDQVHDPLFARVAIFESGENRIALVQLDTLSIRWTTVNDIRTRVAACFGFPGQAILVAATHNHAGPAVANLGDVRRDDAYVETMTQKVVEAFGSAFDQRQEAQVGFTSYFEFDIAHNRRVLMRNGTVRTHGTFDDPEALCLEGPIDPEVGVIAARDGQGHLLGVIVNFACHPTHYYDDGVISAGFPGVLAARMKEYGCPVTLFTNGASGNVHTADPYHHGHGMTMEQAGERLAHGVCGALATLSFRNALTLTAKSATLQLPFRAITDEEVHGTTHGAQRFVDPSAYDRMMPSLLQKIRERGTQPAEVQVLGMDEYALVSIPAEYFVEYGLQIKQAVHPRHALIIGQANGAIGYVPTRLAFEHGGYETTFSEGNRMAPETGELLANCAIRLTGVR